MLLTRQDLINSIKEQFPFESFRNNQLNIIRYILESFLIEDKKYFVLEAPTGIGKSVIAYTVGKVLKVAGIATSSTTIITKSRNLQKQYFNSFNDITSLWGSQHYSCAAFPAMKVSWGTELCSKKQCKYIKKCSYVIARNEFFNADIKVTNYALYLKLLANTGLLVIDESHNIEDILCETFTFSINTDELKEIYKLLLILQIKEELIENIKTELIFYINYIKIPETKFEQEFNKKFLNLKNIYSNIFNILEENITSETPKKLLNKIEFFKSMLENYITILDFLLNNTEKDYVKIVDTNIFKLKPLKASKLIKILCSNSEKILLMSATICGLDEYAFELGLNNYKTLSLDTPFPKENRPIYFYNLPKLNYINIQDLIPAYVNVIDSIIDNFENTHGIIHTVSYSNATSIMNLSRHKNRFILPKKGTLLNLNEVFNNDDNILISPSLTEGIDLNDNLSRFQILFKMPYPNLQDPWIKQKLKINKIWYDRKTIITIVQSYGRSIRHAEDFAFTFILDGNFDRYIDSSLLPNYIKQVLILQENV